MVDFWRGFRRHQHDVATDAFTVDLGVDLEVVPRALYVGAGGTMRVTTMGGTRVDLVVPSGTVLPLRVRRVHAKGTSAESIVGLV